jgi:predicted lipopolysaccharide heptosyltransferase III
MPAPAHPIEDKTAEPRALGTPRWDWSPVERVLVVRLRSIGDTVLATPSLRALRRFLPHAKIDLLVEDWVAPLLDGFRDVDEVLTLPRSGTAARMRMARLLWSRRYDVAYNLHGGTTAGFLVRASGARHRIGFAEYRYPWLYNHLAPRSSELWGTETTHSAEQQLALLGWTGVPVSDRPASALGESEEAADSLRIRLDKVGFDPSKPFSLIHPTAAFDTKRWAGERFAAMCDHLASRGIASVLVAAENESDVLRSITGHSRSNPLTLAGLTLPEVTALARRARLFVGNDSGIAHIAAAVKLPTVVIFGSSNVAHWYPWTAGVSAVVREDMPCAPCPGYTCAEFATPQCIERVTVARVLGVIDETLSRIGLAAEVLKV